MVRHAVHFIAVASLVTLFVAATAILITIIANEIM